MRFGTFRFTAIALVTVMISFFGALEAEDQMAPAQRKPSSLAPLKKSSGTDSLPMPGASFQSEKSGVMVPPTLQGGMKAPWRLGEPMEFNLLSEPPSFDTNGLATQEKYRPF